MDRRDLKIRYARQIAVEQIGPGGQQKLGESSVLVIGCGALGSMVAMQLAAAGIGRIGVADFDKIDISNLQRQFFYTTEETGLSKVRVLAEKISLLNPEIKVELFPVLMTVNKAEGIFENFDFIVDATDNPESKRMIGEISKIKGKPCCIGGVKEFGGQVMTFLPSDNRFDDYFGSTAADGFLPCSIGGVMGPVAALCASIQTSETIKYIIGIGELLTGRLLCFNLLNNSFNIYSL